ncbi:MAG: hypothetical protein R2715_19940 [Ilumatobacteraceae bacterium]
MEIVTLRRRASDNLVVVADRASSRRSVIAAALASVALAPERESIRTIVIDASGGIDGPDDLHDVMRVLERSSSSIVSAEAETLERRLDELLAEISRRRDMTPAAGQDEPSVVLALHDPDRIQSLRRLSTELGVRESPLGTKLRRVLADGPTFGVHVLVSVISVAAWRAILPDRVLSAEIRHRVVFPMPEEDSFVLVRSTVAATMASERGQSEVAATYDAYRQRTTLFRPYGSDESSDRRLADEVAQLSERVPRSS